MNSDRDTLAGGLPHSEIPGSPIARISPGLVAACHVLHRLSVPRHPPDALTSRLIAGVLSCEKTPHRRPRTGPKPLGTYKPSGPNPKRQRPRMKTLLRICPAQARLAPPDISASVTSQLSLFTLQSASALRPRRQAVRFFAKRPGSRRAMQLCCTCRLRRWWRCPGGGALVEVNGFEPMTSCLQSRRSPS